MISLMIGRTPLEIALGSRSYSSLGSIDFMGDLPIYLKKTICRYFVNWKRRATRTRRWLSGRGSRRCSRHSGGTIATSPCHILVKRRSRSLRHTLAQLFTRALANLSIALSVAEVWALLKKPDGGGAYYPMIVWQ